MATDARRIRSPNYPALSLSEAIQRIGPVFERERQHAMAREVVLVGMGYAGVNGAALGSLSAVVKYGLLEKIGEDYRVTDRAVSILHPSSAEEKAEAIREAAHAPALFADLMEAFPDGRVSDDNLRSYLVRRNFSSSALTGVIKAFRDTMQMVSLPEEKPVTQLLPTPQPPQGTRLPQPQPLSPLPTAPSPWLLSTNGTCIELSARLDNADAVDRLIRFLEANKPLLPAKAPDAPAQEGTDETRGSS